MKLLTILAIFLFASTIEAQPPLPPGAAPVVKLQSPKATQLAGKNKAMAVTKAVATAPLVVVKPPPVTTSVSLTFDNLAGGYEDGVFVYVGNQPGVYWFKVALPATNTFTATGMDVTKPWFFAATTYVSNSVPIVTCYTNADKTTVCRTNNFTESRISNEALYLPTNMVPFLMVTNGVPVLAGFGLTNRSYVVSSGTLPNLGNVQKAFTGSNAPWFYPVARLKSGYFKVLVQ